MTARRLASCLLLLPLWDVAAPAPGARTFPGPVAVAKALADETLHGPLLFHLAATLGRVGAGFVLAMLVGTALGIVMGRSPRLDRWLDGPILVLLNLPAIVLAVLVYIWLGLGELAVVVTVAVLKIPNVAGAIPGGPPPPKPEKEGGAGGDPAPRAAGGGGGGPPPP